MDQIPVDNVVQVSIQPCELRKLSEKDKNINEAFLLKKASEAFPGTKFKKAWLSCLPGLIGLEMENGNPAYTDKSFRYLILGLILDSYNGAFIDQPSTETSE